MPSVRRQKTTTGFTLVEVLIVVIILGILAMIVVPRYLSAATTSRESAIKMNLFRMRTQIEVYYQQHGDHPVLATFTDQMTMASNLAGATAAPGTAGYPFGPYIQKVPPNNNTSTATIGNGAAGTSAWYYDETTGEFLANDSVASRAF